MRLFKWKQVQDEHGEPVSTGDDWNGLAFDGVNGVPGIEDVSGITEGHIILESGKLIPANSNEDRWLGKTIRRGQEHVHLNDDHTYHIRGLGEGYSNQDKTLERFKKTEKEIRDYRKSRRA